jgi:Capsule polysaccharide biosynthesis protein
MEMTQKKKVVIFDYWAYYSPHLEVMAAIARREVATGADVRYFACDGSLLACEVDPWGTKIACVNCQKRMAWAGKTTGVQQTAVSLPPGRRYSVDSSQLQSLQSYRYRDINIGMGCASSYISRTRDQELTLNRVTTPVLRRQVTSAKMIVDALHDMFDQEKPDVVYLFNGRGFVNRAILGVCDARKVPYITVEVGANDERVEEYSASLPHSIAARTRMMQDLWLSADAKEKLSVARSFYERKRAGDVTNDQSYVAHQVRGLLPDLQRNKSIIAIFNSSDDEIKSIGDEWSFSASINQYDVVEALLKETADQNVFFIVRMHPNLASVSAPWVKNWERIKEHGNCLFIEATSPISSYEVLDAADKVLVFGSTIGAEAVAAGKPVILYGNSYYERLDICYRATDLQQLAALCVQPLRPRDPEPTLMYAYFLLRSGAALEGYTGNKQAQEYRLLGQVVPIRQARGWRGKGGGLYALNWLGNRLAEWRIRRSLVACRSQSYSRCK